MALEKLLTGILPTQSIASGAAAQLAGGMGEGEQTALMGLLAPQILGGMDEQQGRQQFVEQYAPSQFLYGGGAEAPDPIAALDLNINRRLGA